MSLGNITVVYFSMRFVYVAILMSSFELWPPGYNVQIYMFVKY